MIAPVPYSARTKFAIQIGISSPVNGFTAYAPVNRPSFSAPSASRWSRSWLLTPLTHSSSAARSGWSCEESRNRRMLGGEDHRRRTEDRVGSRREDAQLLSQLRHVEVEVGADGAADPVPLHRADLLGPLPELVEAGEEALGVLRDLQEPLLQLALLDGALAALAGAAFGLLVRQDRQAGGAPVDGPLLPVGEPLLHHPQEEPLVPPVVLRLARRDFLRPVVEDAPARRTAPSSRRCSRESTRAAGYRAGSRSSRRGGRRRPTPSGRRPSLPSASGSGAARRSGNRSSRARRAAGPPRDTGA